MGLAAAGIAVHRVSMGLSSVPRAALYKSPRQQPALPVQHSTQPAPASQITAGNHVPCQLPRKRQGSKPCAEKSPQHSYPRTPFPKRPPRCGHAIPLHKPPQSWIRPGAFLKGPKGAPETRGASTARDALQGAYIQLRDIEPPCPWGQSMPPPGIPIPACLDPSPKNETR